MDEDKIKMLMDMAGKPQEPEEQEELPEDSPEAILEEYKLWRKNCKLMYNFITETALTWPSLSIQMFSGAKFQNKMKDGKYNVVRNLGISTYSEGKEDGEFIKVCSLQIPRCKLDKEVEMSKEECDTVDSRLKISKKIDIGGFEVNKLRINYVDERIVGCIKGDGEVEVISLAEDMEVQWRKKLVDGEINGHAGNGFGLCWDSNRQSRLATGSEDKFVKLWDYKKEGTNLINKFSHDDIVNDVRYSFKRVGYWGSVCEDGSFRLGNDDEVVMKQDLGVTFNSFSFSPFSEHLLFAGSSEENGNGYIYDLRRMDRSLHTFVGHKNSITNVEWDPFHENIVGTSSVDRRIILWDLNKIGEEQTVEESEDGVPELLMMHGGHTSGVNDFAFSRDSEWMLASCSEDNIVHVWQPSDAVISPSLDVPEEYIS